MEKLPQLNPEEIRVLGAMIEKSKTTPDVYPMTLNGLQTACNQKSSRFPVVDYDDEMVVLTLDNLKKKGFIAQVLGGGRVVKYRHTLAIAFPIDPNELTVLCLLFLRGPLTVGEIKTNSSRLSNFETLAEVQEVIDALMNYELPFLTLLPKSSGQKEARYCHLFAEIPDPSEQNFTEEPARRHVSDLENRVSVLEQELAELKKKLEDLFD